MKPYGFSRGSWYTVRKYDLSVPCGGRGSRNKHRADKHLKTSGRMAAKRELREQTDG